MARQKLSELAKTIRSKNAGVDLITFDVIFASRENYERVRNARVLTRESVAKLYGIPLARIADFVEFDPVDSVHLDDGLETPMFYVVQEDDLELVKSYRRRERTE